MVNLKQHGGEGNEAYNGHKSDSSLSQIGGEQMGSLKIKKSDISFTPGMTPTEEYSGPGRFLKQA